MTTTACQTQFAQLEKDFSKFSSHHDAIVTLPGYDAYKYTTLDLYDQTQEIYFKIVNSFKTHSITCKSPSNLDDTVIALNKCLTAVIPSAINIFEITLYQRFIYLNFTASSLNGHALETFLSLAYTIGLI